MDMKEFERFNNIMDASIDKVVTDHLNKLSDIEYCVTTIQNIIANGGNTKTLLTYATECVRTIKDEIEYFNSIDNIIASNLKELEELKGRNRQLKEINQNALDTFKKITKEKDNKIEELNEKIGRLTSENDSMSEIKLNLENEIKLKSDKNESLDSIIKEKDEEIYELNKRIISLETSIKKVLIGTYDKDGNKIPGVMDKLNTDIRNMLTFIKKELIGTYDKDGNKIPGVMDKLNNVNSELNNNIDKISKIKDYESNFKELKEKVDCLNDSINKLDDTEKDEKIAELNDIIQMVKDNAKVMAVSQSCHIRKINKKEMHGKDNPRYNLSVDDNELIKDYEDGMILRELSEKYDMTIPGIRARLINLGVYKKKYNTGK